jgi:hypothetical protein
MELEDPQSELLSVTDEFDDIVGFLEEQLPGFQDNNDSNTVGEHKYDNIDHRLADAVFVGRAETGDNYILIRRFKKAVFIVIGSEVEMFQCNWTYDNSKPSSERFSYILESTRDAGLDDALGVKAIIKQEQYQQ